MEPVVDIQHLDISFATDAEPVVAVRNLSLSVTPGEVLAIVGESGSGKSVTAKAILGLLPETATESGVVLVSVAFVMANVIVDLFYAFLDPRVRY